MMKVKSKHCAEFRNKMDSMKMLIKVQGERHAQFQNAMDLVKNMMKMENKHHTKFRDGFNDDDDDDEENAFDAYLTDGTPSSIQAVPGRDEGTQGNLPCSFHT
jgi:hypothetical protein